MTIGYHPRLEVHRISEGRLEFRDGAGGLQTVFGSHHGFIEEAVLTSLLGSAHFPLVYEGESLGPSPSHGGDEIVKLDCNHSHYICVDNGVTGASAQNAAVAIRNDLESFVSFYGKLLLGDLSSTIRPVPHSPENVCGECGTGGYDSALSYYLRTP